MSKIVKNIKFILVACAVIVVGILAVMLLRTPEKSAKEISPAMIRDIRRMVELCALEVRDEIGVKDTINGKGIFAKIIVDGYISFDLESIDYTMPNDTSDTLFIYLPPEKVTVYEAARPNSYEVMDQWSINFMSQPLTNEEENIIKDKWKSNFTGLMYRKGYVKRARASAVETLGKLFSAINDKVAVVDNYPEGYYCEKFRAPAGELLHQ